MGYRGWGRIGGPMDPLRESLFLHFLLGKKVFRQPKNTDRPKIWLFVFAFIPLSFPHLFFFFFFLFFYIFFLFSCCFWCDFGSGSESELGSSELSNGIGYTT